MEEVKNILRSVCSLNLVLHINIKSDKKERSEKEMEMEKWKYSNNFTSIIELRYGNHEP